MKLTKYEHSCVVLGKDGKSLVIDPGGWSPSFAVPEDVIGIVVTHQHADHLDEAKIRAILEENSGVTVYAPHDVLESVSEDLKNYFQVVKAGETISAANISLNFVGDKHAFIREGVPVCENLGVIVDSLYYHPGDAYFVPEEEYVWLGVPLSAPWAKVAETAEFVKAAKAAKAFQIHDALLGEAGHGAYCAHLQAVCDQVGTRFQVLRPGEQIEL